MAKLIIMAAIGKNGELGKDNDLIWHLKEDLKFFKEKTINHKVVMGYNTFKSLPKLLVNRTHIVLTHHDIDNKDVLVFNNFNDLINYLNNLDEDVYIIGGSKIYDLFMPLVDELILTEIDDKNDADVYFPKFNKDDFLKRVIDSNEEESLKYKHVLYRRK